MIIETMFNLFMLMLSSDDKVQSQRAIVASLCENAIFFKILWQMSQITIRYEMSGCFDTRKSDILELLSFKFSIIEQNFA